MNLLLCALMLSSGAAPADAPISEPAQVGEGRVLYLVLGLASTIGPGPGEGPAFRMGFRYEWPYFALDFAVGGTLDFHTVGGAKEKPRPTSVSGVFPRAVGVWFINPGVSSSPYLSGGISLSGVQQSDGVETFGRVGLSGEAAGGYEWFRDTEGRVFAEAGASLPFYTLPYGADGAYTPNLFILLGCGLVFK
jgi:hypothetical protein